MKLAQRPQVNEEKLLKIGRVFMAITEDSGRWGYYSAFNMWDWRPYHLTAPLKNAPSTKAIRNKLLRRAGHFSVQSLAKGDAAVQMGSLVSREVRGSWHGRGPVATLNKEEQGGLITTKEHSPYLYFIYQKKGLSVWEIFSPTLYVQFCLYLISRYSYITSGLRQ